MDVTAMFFSVYKRSCFFLEQYRTAINTVRDQKVIWTFYHRSESTKYRDNTDYVASTTNSSPFDWIRCSTKLVKHVNVYLKPTGTALLFCYIWLSLTDDWRVILTPTGKINKTTSGSHLFHGITTVRALSFLLFQPLIFFIKEYQLTSLHSLEKKNVIVELCLGQIS